MRCSPGSLLLWLLLASCLSPTHGFLETLYTNLKCKCLRVTSTFIRPDTIDWIKISRPGNGCPNTEIIIWRKNKAICLNPEADWTKKLLQEVYKRQTTPTAQTSVLKRRRS